MIIIIKYHKKNKLKEQNCNNLNNSNINNDINRR